MFQWLIQINSKTLFSSLLLLVVPIALLAQPKNYIKNEADFPNHIVDRLVQYDSDIFIVGFRFDYDSTESLHNRTSLWIAKLNPDSTVTQSYYYQSAEQWIVPLHAQFFQNKLYIYCRSAHSKLYEQRYLIKTYTYNLETSKIADSNYIDLMLNLGFGADTIELDPDHMICQITDNSLQGSELFISGSLIGYSKFDQRKEIVKPFCILISQTGVITSQISDSVFNPIPNINKMISSGMTIGNKIFAFTYYYNFIKYVFDKNSLKLTNVLSSGIECKDCFIMPATLFKYNNHIYGIGVIRNGDRSEFLQSVKYDSNLNVLATQPLDYLVPGTDAVYYRDYLSNHQFFTTDELGNLYLYYTHNNGVMNFAKLNSNLELIWAKRIDARPNKMGMSHRSVNVIGDKIYAYGNYCNDYTSIPFPSCSDTGRHAYIYVMDTSGIITSSPAINYPLEIDIKVYPNPGSEVLHISGHPLKSVLFIYDLNGRLILEKEIMTDEEAIRFLQKGIFIYEIRNSNSEILKRGKLVRY